MSREHAFEGLFQELDTSKNGLIEPNELTLGMLRRGMDPEDISALFRAIDMDNSGECLYPPMRWALCLTASLLPGHITYAEFLAGTALLADTLGEPPPPVVRLSSNLTGPLRTAFGYPHFRAPVSGHLMF